MKFKPTKRAGGVLVELGPREQQLPSKPENVVPPLFRLKKILVPVDFSDCSEKAFQYAAAFARQFGADLTLLFVVQPYPPTLEMGEIDPIGEVTEELEGLRRKVPSSVRAGTVLRRGEPAFEIVKAARELGVDLIIISTHGRAGVARVLMGSTAEKVVRHSGCPVLVVREHEHEFLACDAESSNEGRDLEALV
jgi:universal stress protein A